MNGNFPDKIAETSLMSSDTQLNTSIISDLSLFFENSLVLKSTKYVEKKTLFVFDFILNATADRCCTLLVYVVRKGLFPDTYVGYDSTSYCTLKWKSSIPFKRHVVYGKITNKRSYFVDVMKIEEFDSKKLCYQII